MGKARKSEKASTSSASARNVLKEQRKLGAFHVLQIGTHYSYMKAHEGEDDRTMFLVNLPPDTTDLHLRELFKKAGKVTAVKLWKPHVELGSHDEETTRFTKGKGKSSEKEAEGPPTVIPLPPLDPRHPHHLLPTATSAHITFSEDNELQMALSMSSIEAWPILQPSNHAANGDFYAKDEESTYKQRGKKAHNGREAREAISAADAPIGLDYLLARHRALRPSLDEVKAHVDSVIANYDYRRAHPMKKKSGIQVASVGPNGELLDEDGFIIVQSTGKYGRTSEGQMGASIKVARRRPGEDIEEEAAREKKKKRFELEDFYRFQRREQKREELANLRAKFREDQEKVQKLKSSRSFKPF